MNAPSPQDQEERARQLRRALVGSWLLTVAICAVLVVLDVVPLVIVAAFFVMDTVVLAIVARSARAKGSPSGLT
jgi:Flp pilus assembly protein TadB